MVPTERIELSQDCSYTLLKRARLPIPPRRHSMTIPEGIALEYDFPIRKYFPVRFDAHVRLGCICPTLSGSSP